MRNLFGAYTPKVDIKACAAVQKIICMLPEEAIEEIRQLSSDSSSAAAGSVDATAAAAGGQENGETEFGASLRFVDPSPSTCALPGGDLTLELRRWFREDDAPSAENGAGGAMANGAAFDKAWQRLQEEVVQEEDAEDSVNRGVLNAV